MQTQTAEEQLRTFFAKLQTVKDQEWILKHGRMIRTKDGCCPMEAAYQMPPGKWTTTFEVDDIPLNKELPTIQGMIAHIADHKDCFYQEYGKIEDMEDIRRQMLDLLKPKLEE